MAISTSAAAGIGSTTEPTMVAKNMPNNCQPAGVIASGLGIPYTTTRYTARSNAKPHSARLVS